MNDHFEIFIYVFAFIFSACWGSFANVVIYRLPRKISVVRPPSACPRCNTPIKAYDNLPIFGWILLKGKCRHCKNHISARYPSIEFLTAALGTALAFRVFHSRIRDAVAVDGLFLTLCLVWLFLFAFVLSMIILSMIDIDTTELPPEITLPLIALGLIAAAVNPDSGPAATIVGNMPFLDALLGAVIGAGLVFLIIAVYWLLTKRIGMGGGDIWMMGAVGAFLGWQSLPFVFFLASTQGIIAAVVGIIAGKKQQKEGENALFRNLELDDNLPSDNRKLAVPFGPFIALAAVEYLFFGHILVPFATSGLMNPWGILPPAL